MGDFLLVENMHGAMATILLARAARRPCEIGSVMGDVYKGTVDEYGKCSCFSSFC